jgi:hypothetical protein
MGLLPQKKTSGFKFAAITAVRVTVFFLFMAILTIFLYAIGTAQDFMDSTQLMLLRLTVLWGALLATASFYGFVLDIIVFIRQRKFRSLGGVLVYLFLGTIGLAVLAGALFIITAAAGNAGGA